MTLYWPKDAGEFSHEIALDKKDQEDIQSICDLLNRNDLIKSLGVEVLKTHNNVMLTDNKSLKVRIIFHKHRLRILDKYYWVESRSDFYSDISKKINTNYFVFGSESDMSVGEIAIFRNIPKHILLNIVNFISLVKEPKYFDAKAKYEICMQTGFGEYGG